MRGLKSRMACLNTSISSSMVERVTSVTDSGNTQTFCSVGSSIATRGLRLSSCANDLSVSAISSLCIAHQCHHCICTADLSLTKTTVTYKNSAAPHIMEYINTTVGFNLTSGTNLTNGHNRLGRVTKVNLQRLLDR